jgi:hypothetical protein
MSDRTQTTRPEDGQVDDEGPAEAGHSAHPIEPAEGAREPGEDAGSPRPPHPDEPAEGAR